VRVGNDLLPGPLIRLLFELERFFFFFLTKVVSSSSSFFSSKGGLPDINLAMPKGALVSAMQAQAVPKACNMDKFDGDLSSFLLTN